MRPGVLEPVFVILTVKTPTKRLLSALPFLNACNLLSTGILLQFSNSRSSSTRLKGVNFRTCEAY